MMKINDNFLPGILFILSILLSACGGGGSSSTSNSTATAATTEDCAEGAVCAPSQVSMVPSK